MADDPINELTPDEREALAAGEHARVAEGLLDRGRPELAGWVREQIWDWEGAFDAYRVARRPVDALRVALESGSPRPLDEAMADLEDSADPTVVQAAIDLLQARRRPMEAARLLALQDDAEARARALLRAGDRLGAAQVLADADRPREALDALAPAGAEPTSPGAKALAARLAWDLGDAAGAARYAQHALRLRPDDDATSTLLARALGSLGHDLAAQMVLEGRSVDTGGVPIPGRYRVTGLRSSGLTGAAYLGLDRVTLQEVEIHLLLADQPDAGPVDPSVIRAIERFAASAEAAARIGHPAIRPVLRLEPRAGLLVLPRSEGPSLRSLVRPPGMATRVSRARGLVAFMAEGLEAAHARGLVHGWLLPSQIVCDAVGRPLLGPFGAYHLAGLAATHTAGLDEILMVTAPELGAGAAPTVQSDLFALGTLLLALLHGRIGPTSMLLGEPIPPSAEAEVELGRSLLDTDPAARPDMDHVLEILRAPVADVRELGRGAADSTTAGRIGGARADLEAETGVVVVAADAWTIPLLDGLCEGAAPCMQPILDRDERTLVLAPWPEGSATLGPEAGPKWRRMLPADAFDDLPPEVADAIRSRLQPSSLVRTPSGAWMLALDDLLTR